MAGFQVAINGRFWVAAEVTTSKTIRLTKRIFSPANVMFLAAAKMDASAKNMFGVTRNIPKVKKIIVNTAQKIDNVTKNIRNAA